MYLWGTGGLPTTFIVGGCLQFQYSYRYLNFFRAASLKSTTMRGGQTHSQFMGVVTVCSMLRCCLLCRRLCDSRAVNDQPTCRRPMHA